MTNVIQLPSSPAIEVAKWVSDFIVLVNHARDKVGHSRLQEIDAELAFVRRRWDVSSELVLEFLASSGNSASACQLIDTLQDAVEVLDERWEDLDDQLLTVGVILEIAVRRAFKLVREEAPGKSFVAAFERYRWMLINLSVPKLSKRQRTRVFKVVDEIADLHDSIVAEM